MKQTRPVRSLRARKRFGQNFLTDPGVISRIVGAIAPRPGDHVVEIGPGHGALSAALARAGCRLDVIEIDRDLVAELRSRFPSLHVIEADVLKYDFSGLVEEAREAGRRLRIVGNLPYNISTPLLFKLLHALDGIADMHFMLQLEVVQRMVAKPSTHDYGRLSVMSQYYCQPSRLFSVPAAAFTPRPRVMSAIIRLTPHTGRLEAQDPGLLERVVSTAFSQRRKTIRNALGSLLTEDEIVALSLDPGSRPENLAVEDYVRCANRIAERMNRQPEAPP